MCGIAGIYHLNKKPIEKRLLVKMRDTLVHRGPDSSGLYLSKDRILGLAHRRLSIVDLSEKANQPMSNEDGKIWIVFNGEIYNFKDLARFLKLKGHRFKSNSDTEVIIHLYEDYKEKCLNYLRGMFAFAIWDEPAQKLFLARDRIGLKPLKYYIGPDFFIFASELKAILKHPRVKKIIDFNAVYHYLTFQYVPSPLTGFTGIKKLLPGHYLTVIKKPSKTTNSFEIKTKRYWRLNYNKKLNLSEEEWQDQIINKLKESVKLRMVSDVPLGVFLSGGIDSSTIVALMSKFSSKPVKTFSIGFEETEYNELPFARKVAYRFKTNHHEAVIKPDIIEILPHLVYHYEEPYADPSAIPTFYLSKLAKKHVSVALSGDGGDENFAGYTRYNYYKLLLLYHKIPKNLRKNCLKFIVKILVYLISKGFRREKALRILDQLETSPEKSYLEMISYFSKQQKEEMLTNDFKRQIKKKDRFAVLQNKINDLMVKDLLDQALYADFCAYLPDDLLVKMDIASMANSLEVRSPFLDHEFFELTARVPFYLKLRGLETKYILKKTLQGLLPNEILYRKKTGFRVPLENWLRYELKNFVESILLTKPFINRGFFNKEYITRLIRAHQKTNCANYIWTLLSLEFWLREFFNDEKLL